MTNINKQMILDISSKSFGDLFGSMEFTEVFNKEKLQYILANWDTYADQLVSENHPDSSSTKTLLQNYLKSSKSGNKVSVKYNKSKKSSLKLGRWFANKGLSIQLMPKKVRVCILKGYMMELDFVSCHPTILQWFCEVLNIPCHYLKKYNENRDSIINKICSVKNCTYDEAKIMVLKCINGSPKEINELPIWSKMKEEFSNICSTIAEKRDFKYIYDSVKKSKKEKTYNLNASVTNVLLCIAENNCLEVLYNLLKDEGIIKNNLCVLQFDGIHVPDTEENKKMITPEFLDCISLQIRQQTGIHLKIKIKEYIDYLNITDTMMSTQKKTHVIENGDDKSAADFFATEYPDKLKKCGNRLFINIDNIWTEDKILLIMN